MHELSWIVYLKYNCMPLCGLMMYMCTHRVAVGILSRSVVGWAYIIFTLMCSINFYNRMYYY